MNNIHNYFKAYYNIHFEDTIPTSVPGYWEHKDSKLAYTYFDLGRDPETGKYLSRTKTWKYYRERHLETLAKKRNLKIFTLKIFRLHITISFDIMEKTKI
jgi:hypothetical protein